MTHRSAVLATLVALSGCSTTAAERNASPDASTTPSDLPAIRMKPVDGLSSAQAETLCEEDARRFDPCRERGLAAQSPAECTASIQRCRAVEGDAGTFAVTCRGYDLGPPGSCSTTVDEYLACVDAWNELRTCDNAGRLLDPPAACRHVITSCPRLATQFFQSGTPPPCVPGAGDRNPPRSEEDIYGFDGCRPIPERFVVLGDSIAACYAVGPADCGPLLIAEHVKNTVAPNLVVESHAVSGALMADLPGQARSVAGGPGHVAVWVHILGNDLALRHWDDAGWTSEWNETFDYFTDRSRFPDGATFFLNTQYSPYDQCPNPLGGGVSISVEADQRLQDVNHRVFISLAEERPDTVTIDQYPDWLGHGDNANTRGCPHCGADNTSWMAFDRIHPNALGYAHMRDKWVVALDRMYRCGGD